MPNRYRTLVQVVGPVNANASMNAEIDIPSTAAFNINIVKIQITPTILGGSAIYQIYDRNTFAAGNLVYGTHPIVGIYNDPVAIDADGTLTFSPSAMAFLIPYYDKDEANKLYLSIVNRDAQTKSYDVTITYEIPMINTV